MVTTNWRTGVLLASAAGIAGLFGACTSVLDFTECERDADCVGFFQDNKPLLCDTLTNRCKIGDGCVANSECSALGESFICGLSSTCFDVEAGSDLCDAPVYPEGEITDDIVFVGSIVNRGADAEIENAIRLAIEDFNGNTELGNGSSVAWIGCDDQGDSSRAQDAAEYLIGSPDSKIGVGASALIGPVDEAAFVDVVDNVSLDPVINAFTISSTAVTEVSEEADPSSVVWHAGPSATRVREAMLDAIEASATNSLFTVVNANSAYGFALYNAMSVPINEAGDRVIDVEDVVDEQFLRSYSTPEEIAEVAAAVAAEGWPVLILDDRDIGPFVEAYEAAAAAWPEFMMVPPRGAAAALAAANESANFQGALEVIAPHVPDSGAKTAMLQRYANKYGSEPLTNDAVWAYDSALMTMFAMRAIGNGPIRGPNISGALTSGALSGSVGVTAADPTTYSLEGNVELTGASGVIQVHNALQDLCTDFDSLRYQGGALVAQRRYTVNCPSNTSGSWGDI